MHEGQHGTGQDDQRAAGHEPHAQPERPLGLLQGVVQEVEVELLPLLRQTRGGSLGHLAPVSVLALPNENVLDLVNAIDPLLHSGTFVERSQTLKCLTNSHEGCIPRQEFPLLRGLVPVCRRHVPAPDHTG